MTDQIPAGLTRDEAQAVREWAERALAAEVQDATVVHAARVLLAVLPTPPTQWTLYWLTGGREVIEGPDIVAAMNNAGIGAGALPALDFYKKGAEDHGYRWSADDRSWGKEEK